MRLLIIIILQLTLTFVYGQKTERFNGEFYNGTKIKGEANYSYYNDNNNKKVKHGAFRYSAREKLKIGDIVILLQGTIVMD
jgi:hypothetical protein